MAKRTDTTDADRLKRIVELCDSIAEAMGGHASLEAFAADDVLNDAIAYRLAAIGEEAKKLSDRARAEIDLPWKQIMGMRDRLAHDYFGRAPGVLYATATTDLPPLRAVCVAALRRRPT